MRRILARGLAAVAILLAVVYLGDDVSLRFRIPRSRQQYGVVRIQVYYAVPQKNKTTEFYFQPPQDQTCVHALFPHLGFSPCWYLNRKKQQEIKINM